MAARHIQRRFRSLIASNRSNLCFGSGLFFSNNHNYESLRRGIQTVTKSTSTDPINEEKTSSSADLKVSPRHDAAMFFTCKVCDTRSMKTFCKQSYEKGIVVARCDGCDNLHLIADRLGWFGEPGSVEEFLAARGEEVRKGTPESMNLCLEDLVGKT